MPITYNDLIIYNSVESTDPIMGVTQLPYRKRLAFQEGFTFVSGWEEFISGNGNGKGSQIIIRQLGKGKAERVNVEDANALDYNAEYEGDNTRTIPVDVVIKKSEKIYEPVEAARQSASGAKKAQNVLDQIFDEFQLYLTETLIAEANVAAETTEVTDEVEWKNMLIDEMTQELDRVPRVLMVGRKGRAKALKLQTTGEFVAVYDGIRSGLIGTLLGMDVVYNEYLEDEIDHIMYDPNYFFAFNNFYAFNFKDTNKFEGSLVNGMLITRALGDRDVDPTKTNPLGIKRVAGNGAWGVVRKVV